MKKILALTLGMCGAMAVCVPLPAYSYSGSDPVMAAVTDYLTKANLGFEPEAHGVMVPVPIVHRTEMNEDRTRATVYGSFWLFTYVLDGKVLRCTSSGEHPGVMKLALKDGRWTVVSMQRAEQGHHDGAALRAIARGDQELLDGYSLASSLEEGLVPYHRRVCLMEYIHANGLDVEAYRDIGQNNVYLMN